MKKVKFELSAVNKLFEKNEHQSEILIELYKWIVPNWENVVHVNGFPMTNKETSLMFNEKFISFDKKFHPNVMAGGLWLNNGFSTLHNYNIPDNEIWINEDIIEYKDPCENCLLNIKCMDCEIDRIIKRGKT